MIALLMLVGAVSASPLVHYPNGAAVPYDANNVAATNAHLLNKGLAYGLHYPYAAAGYHYLGKREAEADPALVTYSNGAVVPFDPAHHSVYSAYPYAYNFGLYGKKKREADPAYLVNTYAAYHPSTYYAGYHPYGLVHQPLVAHLNGAVVPAEPIEVQDVPLSLPKWLLY